MLTSCYPFTPGTATTAAVLNYQPQQAAALRNLAESQVLLANNAQTTAASIHIPTSTLVDDPSPSNSYSALPVGFYHDAEIREVWDREFQRQKHAITKALLSSREYACESQVWNDSVAGLRLMSDELEEIIREATGLPPATNDYGSLWQGLPLQQLCQQVISTFPTVQTVCCAIPVSIFGYSFYDGAKVRFRCSQCPKEWTSMKGRIVFHLFRMDSLAPYLTNPNNTNEVLLYKGYNLFFKVFKQQCHDSTGHKQGDKTVFEEPQWYPEEIQKVLYNVFWRIGQTVYQVSIGEKNVQMWRRSGNPSHQHDKTSCQACQQGFCQGRSK